MAAGRPFSPGLIFSVLGSIVTLCALLAHPVHGQYSQDWSFTNNINGDEEIWWRPTLNSQDYRIWDFSDRYLIFLEYNCAYMTAICENAENFLATPRAQARRYPYAFAYDLGGRTTKRRRASCPSSWAKTHSCPEFNQPTVWRQDGAWWTTALDPVQVPNNVIEHVRDNQGRVTSNSYLRYTCDEFPPATWVEGGSGLANNVQTAQTRCAAYRCPGTAGMKVYGEQNWQARAHTKLQEVLKQAQAALMTGLNWDRKNEPLLFYFRTDYASPGNGFPARVVVASPAGNFLGADPVPLQKREQALKVANMTDHEFRAWANTVDLRDLEDYGFHVRSHGIHENDTFAASLMGRDMEAYGNVSLGDAWWDDEETELPPQIQPRAPKPNLLPTPPVRAADSGSDSASPRPGAEGSAEVRRQEPTAAVDNDTATSLASNATAADIEAARKMVEAAIAESGDLNRARYAHMARNRYTLKPGTIVGGQPVAGRGIRSMRRRAAAADSLEDAPPPLFEVTPELAAAAALLAELDAAGGLGANASSPSNTTQSVLEARAGGTYWMETIARKGTVPWGDDPSYKVSDIQRILVWFSRRLYPIGTRRPDCKSLPVPVQSLSAFHGLSTTSYRFEADVEHFDDVGIPQRQGLRRCRRRQERRHGRHQEGHERRFALRKDVQRLDHQECHCLLPAGNLSGLQWYPCSVRDPSHRRRKFTNPHHSTQVLPGGP